MIVQPERHIEAMIKAGADRITVHYETCPHLHRVVQRIRELGAQPAVAINPHVPAMMLREILPFVDMVLVMTVNPGYGGQKFVVETLTKIRQVRMMADESGLELDIQVDGGITPETTAPVVMHGATVLVAGTAVFHAPGGISAGIEKLRRAYIEQVTV